MFAFKYMKQLSLNLHGFVSAASPSLSEHTAGTSEQMEELCLSATLFLKWTKKVQCGCKVHAFLALYTINLLLQNVNNYRNCFISNSPDVARTQRRGNGQVYVLLSESLVVISAALEMELQVAL